MRRLILLLAAFSLFGQPAPRFDVASIKPTNDDRLFYRMGEGGVLTANCVVVNLLLWQAFGLPATQFAGGPAWLETDHWTIQAKSEAIQGRASRQQEQAMLINLLEDRFHLKYHRERQERPVYALVVAKGGAKLQTSKSERANVRVGTNIQLEKQTMDVLSQLLSERLARPVLNQTGLGGEFDLTLDWMPDYTLESFGLPGMKPPQAAPDNGKPNLMTALQEQLGLRLESSRAMVDVIVIDHIERPSEN